MNACPVCGMASVAPLYVSSAPRSLTSSCLLEERRTVVYRCRGCDHLHTAPPPAGAPRGGADGRVASDWRTAQRLADVVLGSVDVPHGGRLLDFGAGDGDSARLVAGARPDVEVNLFDTSGSHRRRWREFARKGQWAVGTPPSGWEQSFDVLTALHVLERAPRPATMVAVMRSLLRPGGRLCCVVADVAENPADFVVVDHLNHFSTSSLRRLLEDAGLIVERIDGLVAPGALVTVARRPIVGRDTRGRVSPAAVVAPMVADPLALAEHWRRIGARVAEIETALAGRPAAVYGSAFYASFVVGALRDPSVVRCFVDRNPYLRRRDHLDRPVIAPEDLPPGITDVVVGLDPVEAAHAIAAIACWRDAGLQFHYL